MQNGKIELDSGGLTLRGELWVPEGPADTLVVLCHGIPLSRPDPADGGYPELARRIRENGYAALFVNFRGTGDSGGNFHLGGWYCDLETVMGFVADELSKRFSEVCLAGFSAGGALAIMYAAQHGGVRGVAAFAAPAEFSRIFPEEHVFAFLELARDVGIIKETSFPPSPDLFYKEIEELRPVEYISRVSPAPLLLVHGEGDELVPVADAGRLFEAAREPKELVLLPGGQHRLRRDPRALDCLLGWLESLTGSA
jgi:alpha-beta hydrolase superfamily lysophospholipase